MRRLLAILALTLFGLAACGPQPGRRVEVLRYASAYSPNHPFSRADITWIKYVERESGGRLKIQPFWGGTLVSSDQSVLELRHGVADIALITPIYTRSGMQLIKAQSGFYSGALTIADQVAVYRCLSRSFPAYDQEMAGVRVLAVQGGNLPHVLTRTRPVRSLDDLRGLRLRAPSELVPVLRTLGVDVVTMPMGEVYSAISKGVIDGVVAPGDAIKSLHFNEVARHMTMLQVPRGAYPGRAISEPRWRSLPPDLQAVLERSTPVWEAAMAKEIGKSEAVGLAFGKAHGVEFIAFDPAEQARFDAAYDAAALANARELGRYGIDGPAIYRQAKAVIAGGSPARCAGA
jgi:TRAP-type C4-dicarboxylate transport system substrate-binding protein